MTRAFSLGRKIVSNSSALANFAPLRIERREAIALKARGFGRWKNLSDSGFIVDKFFMEEAPSTREMIRRLAAENRLLRPADLEGPSSALAKAEKRGVLYRVIPGVYIGVEHRRHPLIEAAAWTLRHPRVVACLLTAAVYQKLTDAFERGTWLFVPEGSTPPRSRTTGLHVVQLVERLIDPALDEQNGIITVPVHGVNLRLTGPDRTVLDLLRYRRKVSVEHALEALRRRVSAPDFKFSTFARLASNVGVWSHVEPILQGLVLR